MKLLVTAYILNIIDYLFTSLWVSLYGISIEGNPFGRWLFENNLASFFKIVVVGAIFAFLAKIGKRRSLGILPLILFVVYALICFYHLYILFSIK